MLNSKKPIFKLTLFIGIICSICFLTSCQDDDDINNSLPLTYDATKHIYGTASGPFPSSEKWEVIINPQTGAYDSISGTKNSDLIYIHPSNSGTKNLTDFDSNKRIFWNHLDFNLVVQDLESLEKVTIKFEDSISSTSGSHPLFFSFGASNDIVYVLDQAGTLWLVNLSTNSVEMLFSGLYFDNHVLDYQLYLESTNQLVYGGHIGSTNVHISNAVFTFDLNTGEINSIGNISDSFGWVMSPQSENILCLTTPTDQQGFRLMQFRIIDNNLQTELLSQEDLPIDNMSFHTQTIHSATNTYICRGGKNNENISENNLYSIDISSGEIVQTIMIDENYIHSLKGE